MRLPADADRDRVTLRFSHPAFTAPVETTIDISQAASRSLAPRELYRHQRDDRLQLERLRDASAVFPWEPRLLRAQADLLLESEVDDLRDAAAALPVAQRAVEYSAWSDGLALDVYARALWDAGDKPEAARIAHWAALMVDEPEIQARALQYNQSLRD